MSANKIVFNDSVNIGQNGAEHDDEFLFKCFIDHPAYSEITDVNSPTTFLLGSTGAGKTAILRMINKQEENVADLAVHDMAMNHIANSDTILFLTSLGIDLSLFFQALWKHVFCIEYIKLATHARDKDQFHYKITRLIETLTRSRAREKLESFVSNHADQFWNTIDETVIELTDSLENEFNASFGGGAEEVCSKSRIRSHAGISTESSTSTACSKVSKSRDFVGNSCSYLSTFRLYSRQTRQVFHHRGRIR